MLVARAFALLVDCFVKMLSVTFLKNQQSFLLTRYIFLSVSSLNFFFLLNSDKDSQDRTVDDHYPTFVFVGK